MTIFPLSGEKIAEEIVELYEMLGLIPNKKVQGEGGVVNEVQVNNGMAAQLMKLTRQFAFLNGCVQPNNEMCGIYGVFWSWSKYVPIKFI